MDISNLLTTLFIALLVSIVVFLILREVNMWYWKINKRIQLQEKTNSLLQQILDTNLIGKNEMENIESKSSKLSDHEKLSLNDIYKKGRENK